MNRKQKRGDDVTDSGGTSKRFHGSFTGGFSAGYFNTVGSQEGFKPVEFKSSRRNRAKDGNGGGTFKQKSKFDYMDSEDGLLGQQLTQKDKFDTFDTNAAHYLQKSSESFTKGSAIPGPLPSEFIVASTNPIGKRLLKKLGWKEGQGIGSRIRKAVHPGVNRDGLSSIASADDASITVAPSNTDIETAMPRPKEDLGGIGYDGRDTIVDRRKQIDSSSSSRGLSSSSNSGGVGGLLGGNLAYDSDGEYDVYDSSDHLPQMPSQSVYDEPNTSSVQSTSSKLDLDSWLDDNKVAKKSLLEPLSGFVRGKEGSEYQPPFYEPETPDAGFTCIHVFIEDMTLDDKQSNIQKEKADKFALSDKTQIQMQVQQEQGQIEIIPAPSGERPLLTSVKLLQSTFSGVSQTFKNRFTPATATTTEEVENKVHNKAHDTKGGGQSQSQPQPSKLALERGRAQREIKDWMPHPLLSKRMNIPALQTHAERQAINKEAVNKNASQVQMEKDLPIMFSDIGRNDDLHEERQEGSKRGNSKDGGVSSESLVSFNDRIHEELNIQKPAMEVFKSIFAGSDDEYEED